MMAANADPHWWAGPASTVVAVLVVQLVVVYLYFASRRAEDERRWHEKRLDLYVSFLDDSRQIRRSLESVEQGEEPRFIPSDALSAAIDDLQHHVSRLDIIAPEPVGDAATGIWAAFLVMWASLDVDLNAEGHRELWQRGEQMLLTNQQDFERAVRKSLGVREERQKALSEEELAAIAGDDEDDELIQQPSGSADD